MENISYFWLNLSNNVISWIAGKSKLARRIRKEIVKVRRKLAIQKGQHASDIEDTADTGKGYSQVDDTSW